MSSIFATIPKTAPFSEEDVALLNQVVGPASPIQRAWLAGFLAGVESVQGGQAEAVQPAAPAKPAVATAGSAKSAAPKTAAPGAAPAGAKPEKKKASNPASSRSIFA